MNVIRCEPYSLFNSVIEKCLPNIRKKQRDCHPGNLFERIEHYWIGPAPYAGLDSSNQSFWLLSRFGSLVPVVNP